MFTWPTPLKYPKSMSKYTETIAEVYLVMDECSTKCWRAYHLTSLDPVGLPFDPLGPCRPDPWPLWPWSTRRPIYASLVVLIPFFKTYKTTKGVQNSVQMKDMLEREQTSLRINQVRMGRPWRVGLFYLGLGLGRFWPKTSGCGFGYCAYFGKFIWHFV